MEIELIVNGRGYKVNISGRETLLEVLRDYLRMTGTKEGCGKGECGACTVIMDDRAVNACLVLATQAHKKRIITIEGLERDDILHPLQKAFMEKGAVQCGFCTPGMIMSAYGLLLKNKSPSYEDVKLALAGNLCRCTGYEKIILAVLEASKEMRNE